MPWDEEFLLAALLHDVGKGIDPADHVAAGVTALEGSITPRTEFLISHHMDALAYYNGTLGHRAKIRLRESEDFDDLMLLRDLDTAGRKRGVPVCEVSEALEFIRSLNEDKLKILKRGNGKPQRRDRTLDENCLAQIKRPTRIYFVRPDRCISVAVGAVISIFLLRASASRRFNFSFNRTKSA